VRSRKRRESASCCRSCLLCSASSSPRFDSRFLSSRRSAIGPLFIMPRGKRAKTPTVASPSQHGRRADGGPDLNSPPVVAPVVAEFVGGVPRWSTHSTLRLNHDVSALLARLGLTRFAGVFARDRLSVAGLVEMTEEIFNALDVGSGPRKTLRDAVASLSGSGPSRSSTDTPMVSSVSGTVSISRAISDNVLPPPQISFQRC
jgi:hypothetical protein